MLVVLIAIAQTFLLSGHSLVGDGIVYRETFEALRGVGIGEGFEIFQDGLSASEFFSYLVFYGSSQVIDYDLFVYLTNIALSLVVYRVYKRYGKGIGWYLATVPLNFYFLALCFGAQRLKLGILFLFLAAVASTASRSRLLVGLSLFSHFQLVIVLVAERVRGFFGGAVRLPWIELTLIAALSASLFMTVPAVQFKVLAYVLERGEVNLFTFFASFLIAAYVSKFDLGVLAQFCFFLALILVIGESRINILVFFLLWRLIFLGREWPALVAYVIALYLSVKGVVFMIDIANGGTGFGVP